MSGRIGTAPCGHRGECVIGNFYRCLEGCDAVEAIMPSLGTQRKDAAPADRVLRGFSVPIAPAQPGPIRFSTEQRDAALDHVSIDQRGWTTVPDERQRTHRLGDSWSAPRYQPAPHAKLRSLTFYDDAGVLLCRFPVTAKHTFGAEMWELRGVALADGRADYAVLYDNAGRELVRFDVGPGMDIDWRDVFYRDTSYTVVVRNPFVWTL